MKFKKNLMLEVISHKKLTGSPDIIGYNHARYDSRESLESKMVLIK